MDATEADDSRETNPSAPHASTVTRENFQLGAVLGEGGMGIVYEAQDLTLGRSVAIKYLRQDRRSHPQAKARFLAEAQITSQLEHPGIVPIFEVRADAAGEVFYAMRRVRGITLAQILSGISQGDPQTVEKYSLSALLTIFQKVCDAVAYAHTFQVIHRDLKPENVIVGEFGQVTVMDWGLAKVLAEKETPESTELAERGPAAIARIAVESAHTVDGSILGTLSVMSPEQASGRVGEINERTDIFALGGLLYRILTLRAPLGGKTIKEMIDHAQRAYIPPPVYFNRAQTVESAEPSGSIELAHCPGRKVPEALSAVVMKALAADPGARYQTVAQIQADVTAYQTGFATSVEEAGLVRQLLLLLRRHKTESFVASIAAVLLLAMLGVFAWKTNYDLAELRKTAPAFQAEARSLIGEQKLELALAKISYALQLRPNDPESHVLRGHILQALRRLPASSEAYATALRLTPNNSVAGENLRLNKKLTGNSAATAQLSVEDLETLRTAMIRQRRTAEAMAILAEIKGIQGSSLESWNAQLVSKGLNARVIREPNGRLRLDLTNAGLTDLSAVSSFEVDRLSLANNKIQDLTPLERLPLKYLDLTSTKVTDLRPLRDMPLETLILSETPVSDLHPIVGLKLKRLWLTHTKVADLTPLKDMPLEGLGLQGTRVTDLSVLQTMALRELSLFETSIRDLSKLKGLPLVSLYLNFAPVSDLTPLTDMPLGWLDMESTQVVDLTPLKRMPLRHLGLARTRVKDLRPLAGMKLQELDLTRTKIEDLGPLRGMPLKSLRLEGCTALADISGLTNFPSLENLTIPESARNIEVLRNLPKLKRLSYNFSHWRWQECMLADDFWKAYDLAGKKR